jgi:hypothetical protein
MKTKNNTLVWHLDARLDSLQLLRIVLNDRTTRIDFGYQSNPKYDFGWWINIFPETHLISSASDRKFRMQDQQGMVVAPNRFHLEARTDWHFFTLYFAPLPIMDQSISLIESEEPDEDNFNMKNISLKLADALFMKID